MLSRHRDDPSEFTDSSWAPLSHREPRFTLGRLLMGSEGLWLRLLVFARNGLPVSVPLLTARPSTVRVPLEPSAPPRAQV